MLKEVKVWQFYQAFILVTALLVFFCGFSRIDVVLGQFSRLCEIWVCWYKFTHLILILHELGGFWYNKGYSDLFSIDALGSYAISRNYTEFLSIMPRNASIWFATKLLVCIAMLIFVRGGLPRYRYDYLTKIGWLKFLGFTFIVFFYTLLFFILY